MTDVNLVMLVALTITAFFFSSLWQCLLFLCPFLVVPKNRYLPKQMYVSDKSQEECLLDHRKFPVQEEILGLPVEQSIVGLLAEVPLPQLQLTRRGWKIVGTAFCSHIAQKSLN